jgi:hypothetical protein
LYDNQGGTVATQKPKAPRKRGRNPLSEGERKDRLIQTRVADELESTLRDEAKKRRVTVSQLIRNVLEDTFNLVDHVVASSQNLAKTVQRDARRIAESAQGRAREPLMNPPPGRGDWTVAEAWQEMIAVREMRCSRCDTRVGKGEKVFLGYNPDPNAPRAWLCPSCEKKL